eukprot:3699508-Pyramimonas_sp.AAC.1
MGPNIVWAILEDSTSRITENVTAARRIKGGCFSEWVRVGHYVASRCPISWQSCIVKDGWQFFFNRTLA